MRWRYMGKEIRMTQQLNGLKKVFRCLLTGPTLTFAEYGTRVHMEVHILYDQILQTLTSN